MNAGDVIVCGVASDHVVEDIAFPVPKGVPTRIPGDKAHRSKDLWRAISQNILFRLTVLPGKKPQEGSEQTTSQNSVSDLQRQLDSLREELSAVTTERDSLRYELLSAVAANSVLKSDVERLTVELKTRSEADGKLDLILQEVRNRSRVVEGSGKTEGVQTPDMAEAPMFIPSTIRPEGVTERITVKEESAESSSVSKASNKLRELTNKRNR